MITRRTALMSAAIVALLTAAPALADDLKLPRQHVQCTTRPRDDGKNGLRS